MPVTVGPECSGRFVILTVTDPHTFEDWRAAVLSLLNCRLVAPRCAILVDRRAAAPPTRAAVDEMLEFLEEHVTELGGRHVALVATDDGGFGMARMTELKAEFGLPGVTVRTFRDYEEAVAWLTGHEPSTPRNEPD
jgi:hypothetical protein